MQPHLTHVALHVRDLDACIVFYRRICGLTVVHERTDAGAGRVVWMAEPGRQHDFVFVMFGGGPARERPAGDYGHLGFACSSRDEVDAVAAAGRDAGCLLWAPREEPFPVGYYCGLLDPDGNAVEFSFGQPLGPGAAPLSDAGGR